MSRRTFWIALTLLGLALSPCFAEEEWKGYKVNDTYYDQYTGEAKGIVTEIMFLRGKVNGVRYSERLYEERKQRQVREDRERVLRALEDIARELKRR